MMVQHGPSRVHLLPGEVVQSDLLDDATHWAAVYEELSGFLVQAGTGLPSETLERFRRRLAYWRRRREELAG